MSNCAVAKAIIRAFDNKLCVYVYRMGIEIKPLYSIAMPKSIGEFINKYDDFAETITKHNLIKFGAIQNPETIFNLMEFDIDTENSSIININNYDTVSSFEILQSKDKYYANTR